MHPDGFLVFQSYQQSEKQVFRGLQWQSHLMSGLRDEQVIKRKSLVIPVLAQYIISCRVVYCVPGWQYCSISTLELLGRKQVGSRLPLLLRIKRNRLQFIFKKSRLRFCQTRYRHTARGILETQSCSHVRDTGNTAALLQLEIRMS